MLKVGFTVAESLKRVGLMILLIFACLVVWLIVSALAGQTIYHEPAGVYPVYMGGRLIGSH